MSALFSEIQSLFERTYAGVGINLEECLINRRRSRQLELLAGAQARELSTLARTFLRAANARLRVGIYYSQWLIEQLESQCDTHYRDHGLRARYSETTHLAARYTKFLESLVAARRIEEIRTFHALGYDEKRGRILQLTDRKSKSA